jgi:hypothetical protein
VKVVTTSVPAARAIAETSAIDKNVFRIVQATGIASDLAGVFG